jgi:hypothetical protein
MKYLKRVMKNKVILFILIINSCIRLNAQVDTGGRYIVISFEKKVNKFPQHGIQSFFWIVKTDSIKNKNFLLQPLFLDQFSKNDFEACCKGGVINPFVMTTETKFGDQSIGQRNLLDKIINDKKKKVQTITKKWAENYVEEITIFATPIKGKFCSCTLKQNDEDASYNGRIFMAVSSFTYDSSYWELKSSRNVMFADYSKLNFDIKPW